jgi:hypothetical protein
MREESGDKGTLTGREGGGPEKEEGRERGGMDLTLDEFCEIATACKEVFAYLIKPINIVSK